MLLRLVSSSADGEPVCSRVATRALVGDADRERVLGLLVRARLVTAEEDTVELAHEALARAWPRLRSWLEEDAAGQQMLRHLSTAADGWESLGRPATELYRGARLEAVLEWRAAGSADLTDLEAAFLDASVAGDAAERDLQANRARVQARQRRRLRRALAGAAVLLIAAVAGGIVAYQQRQNTDRERREAAVAALAGRSEALGGGQGDLAALLAVEAYRRSPSAASESALFATLTAAGGLQRVVRTDLDVGFVAGGSFVANSEKLALVDVRGRVHVIDLASGDTVELDAIGDDQGQTGISVSGDGRYLAVFSNTPGTQPDALLTTWDLHTGERRFDAVRIPFRIWSVAISEDGALVAASGANEQRTQILDGATGRLRSELEPLAPSSDGGIVTDDTVFVHRSSVAFAADGRLLVGSTTGVIRIVDPTTGAELQRIEGPPRTSETALFPSADGTELVAAGALGVVGFDIESGQPLSANPQRFAPCPIFTYAELIRAILCPSGSRVIAHDVATGAEFDPGFDARQGDVCGLVVSADGARLATVSCTGGGAVITEWRLDGGGPISRLAFRTSEPHSLQGFGFAGDGSKLVARIGGENGETVAIDPQSGIVIDRFPDAHGLAPTEDPNVAIAVLADGTVARYDVVAHEVVGPRVDPGFRVEPDPGVGALLRFHTQRGGHVVVGGVDENGDQRVQGVDLETGRLVAPAIDSNGEFEFHWYAQPPTPCTWSLRLGLTSTGSNVATSTPESCWERRQTASGTSTSGVASSSPGRSMD